MQRKGNGPEKESAAPVKKQKAGMTGDKNPDELEFSAPADDEPSLANDDAEFAQPGPFVVGIGASAGGLEARRGLFSP